ncbi:MAG: hypothetical protein VX938_01130, partial [Myxococcota bacterium]|nr:hypothetical protein [Myxococcota bacterium]
ALVRVSDGLGLPLRGELYLLPRWVQLHLPGAADGEPIRLQTALRVVRADGSVTHWWLGSERSSPSGEGARTVTPQSFSHGASSQTFGKLRLGPVRLEGVTGIELLVSELTGTREERHLPRLIGAASLARAPVASGVSVGGMNRASETTSAAGGVLRLAAHLSVVDTPASPGRHHKELILVALEGDEGWPDSLELDDMNRGKAWVGLDPDQWRLVMVVGLEVDLQDHDGKGTDGGGARGQ